MDDDDRTEAERLEASYSEMVTSTLTCDCGSKFYLEEGWYVCPTADWTDDCNQAPRPPRKVPGAPEPGTGSGGDDGGVPCVSCGRASGKNPCPRCGRYKW